MEKLQAIILVFTFYKIGNIYNKIGNTSVIKYE